MNYCHLIYSVKCIFTEKILIITADFAMFKQSSFEITAIPSLFGFDFSFHRFDCCDFWFECYCFGVQCDQIIRFYPI